MHGYMSIGSSRAADKRGFVLPAVIFSLAIMGLLAVVAVRTADDERRSDRALRESGTVLYADEAGLRSTIGAWPTTAVKALNPGDSLNLGWQLLSNRASHRVVIHRVDNGGLPEYAVVVQAKGAGPLGGQSTVVQMVSAVSVFRWGIFTETGITLTGGAGTDGYDSRKGPYNPLSLDSTGSVATNGSISMSGGPTIVKGDAAAVGTVTGGTVTGAATNGAASFPHMPNLACPTGGYTPSVPSGRGISYDAATGVLHVDGRGNVMLSAPPTQYYFSEVVLTGGSTLTVNSGGQHVDIYIEKKLDISGGGILNPSAQPTQLALWACGIPNATQWTLTGGSGAYFRVYAPSHPVVITGGSDLWGAVVGASYTATGGSKLHYDEGLAQLPSKLLTVVTGSWAQLGVN